MRELKFRAWDTKFKEMLHEDYMVSFLGDVYCNYKIGAIKRVDDGLIVMQYTGIKDKNGKDIYEGDIVKTTTIGEASGKEASWLSSVRFIEDSLEWNRIMPSGTEYRLTRLPLEKCIEIIGNIYENPELIK